MGKHYQVAVIGAGPGGLGAATNAAKHGLSHILFEKSELANTIYEYQLRKHVMAEPTNLPLRAEIPFNAGTREEILETWQNRIDELRVNLVKAEITEIQKTAEGSFQISSSSDSWTADSVVLAIGEQGTPRKLEVEGGDLSHVAYTLSDPGAFDGEDILVIGAGDSAIENALALAEKNSVSILNRKGEFARAKDANARLILQAINAGKIRGYYNATIARVESENAYINTPEGEIKVRCTHIIARLGAILPRKFLESCGIEFPSTERSAVPRVSEQYESNVPGLYIIGALIGYQLIKQAINQGYEVIEHIIGNPVEPADQVIIDEKLGHLPGDTNENLSLIRERLRLFRDLSTPQFRELISDSTVHIMQPGEIVFQKDDFTDTFFSVIQGSVLVDSGEDSYVKFGEGNFFGEVGLFSGRRRSATVVVHQECILLETQRRQILKLISSVGGVKTAVDQVFILRTLQGAIFPDADPELLRNLLPKVQSQNFKKGETLFQEGDEGDRLYVIRKGSVKISRRNREGLDIAQTYIPAGNYVGEMALLSPEPIARSATVSAAVACETVYVEKADFQELLAQNPVVEEKIRKLAEERKIENLINQQDTGQGELLDFMFTEGVTDAENILLIDSDLCVGCDNCEKACAATHNGYSRLDRKGGKSLASIQVPISCRHCENPLCMLDCPPDALRRQPDGEVVILDTCIGCGNCQANCPYGVIQMVYDKPHPRFPFLSWFGFGGEETPKEESDKGIAKAAKCDMCAELSGGPACVRSCPTGAALRVNPSQMAKLVKRGSSQSS